MTLSFKDWFDGRSKEAQAFIIERCKDWMDLSTPDYYKAQKTDISIEDVVGEESEYYSRACLAMYILSHNKKATITDYATYYKNHEYRSVDFSSLTFLPVKDRKDLMRQLSYRNSSTIGLREWLFCIEDYSKLADYAENLNLDDDRVNDTLIDIFGEDFAIKYTKAHESIIHLKDLPEQGRSVIFDTLFFGADGWSEQQKQEIMKRWAQEIHWHSGRYDKEGKLKAMEKAIRHVACARKEDLKYIYTIIKRLPDLAQHLYDMKKPEDQINEGDSKDMEYRFPMWLRKLFVIMGCCARGNISSANTQKLQKEGASLLRMYNFDFDTYFAAYLQQSPDF